VESSSVRNRTSDKQNRGRPICLMTCTDTMTDQIRRHEVLLPVNHTITKLEKGKGENFPGRKHNRLVSFLFLFFFLREREGEREKEIR